MGEAVFTAEIDKWICVKKFKTEPNSSAIEVARGLASIHDSMDRKIWEYLGKEFDITKLDKIAYEITGAEYNEKKKTWELKGRKSEAQIAEALAKLSSPTTTRAIESQTTNGLEIQKAYLSRKVLDLLGIRLELDPKDVDKYLEERSKLPQ